MTKHITMVFDIDELSDKELDLLSERCKTIDFVDLKQDLSGVLTKSHTFQEGLQRVVGKADDDIRELALQYLREGLNCGS